VKYYVLVDNEEFEIEISSDGNVYLDGEPIQVDMVRIPGQNVYSLLLNHHSYEMAVEEERQGYTILVQGHQFHVRVEDERQRRLMAGRNQLAPPGGDTQVTAPIPGRIVKVEVTPGDEVDIGQPLVILEAMKMENEIRSHRAGRIRAVHVSPGDSVEQGAVLLTFE